MSSLPYNSSFSDVKVLPFFGHMFSHYVILAIKVLKLVITLYSVSQKIEAFIELFFFQSNQLLMHLFNTINKFDHEHDNKYIATNYVLWPLG